MSKVSLAFSGLDSFGHFDFFINVIVCLKSLHLLQTVAEDSSGTADINRSESGKVFKNLFP